LKRLEAREAKIFKDTEAEISREGSSGPKDPQRGGRDAKAAGDKLRDLGREGIQKDITTLRQKLESRKKLEALDKSVEKAKDDVITCLRMNDRRPLDCWKEVETFRLEVGKLEKDFVDKALA
jgi:altered-inheritance-of-mitochondria protein 13